jgi:hypothetical protein
VGDDVIWLVVVKIRGDGAVRHVMIGLAIHVGSSFLKGISSLRAARQRRQMKYLRSHGESQ